MPKSETPLEDSECLEQMYRALYGTNGNVGLIAKVDKNTEKLDKILEDIKWATRLLTATLIALGVTAVWNLIVTSPLP